MYSLEIKSIAISIYNSLHKFGIKGQKRIDFMTTNFNNSMSSLYSWINENENVNISHNDIKTDYENLNITKDIENIVILYSKNTDITSIKNLKNKIFKNFKISISSKIISCILKKNNICLKNLKITLEIEKFVVDNIKNNNVLRASDLIKLIIAKFNKNLSYTSIYNILKKYNYTYKNVIIKNNPNILLTQQDRLIEFKNSLEAVEQQNLVSTDEMSIIINEKPKKGWATKGKCCIIKSKNAKIKGSRFTVIMSVSTDKIFDFKIVDKGLKTDDCIKYFNKLNSKNKKNNYSFILDNASVHHSKDVMKTINQNKTHIIFNAPYYSEFNPIEYVFSILRNKLQRNNVDNLEDIIKVINELRLELTKDTLTNIFNHCYKELSKKIIYLREEIKNNVWI